MFSRFRSRCVWTVFFDFFVDCDWFRCVERGDEAKGCAFSEASSEEEDPVRVLVGVVCDGGLASYCCVRSR